MPYTFLTKDSECIVTCPLGKFGMIFPYAFLGFVNTNFWHCTTVALKSPEPVSDAHAAKLNPSSMSCRPDTFSGRKIRCYFESSPLLFASLCFTLCSINRSEMFDIRNWLFYWI